MNNEGCKEPSLFIYIFYFVCFQTASLSCQTSFSFNFSVSYFHVAFFHFSIPLRLMLPSGSQASSVYI